MNLTQGSFCLSEFSSEFNGNSSFLNSYMQFLHKDLEFLIRVIQILLRAYASLEKINFHDKINYELFKGTCIKSKITTLDGNDRIFAD